MSATAGLAILLQSCAAAEVFALLVSTCTFGDVIVAVLPARGARLSKILGFPVYGFRLDPRIFGSGVGGVGSFFFGTVTMFVLSAAFGVSVVDDDGLLL